MKDFKFSRAVDAAGKVNIPIEFREALGWYPNFPLEVTCNDKGEVIIKARYDKTKMEIKEEIIHDLQYGYIDKAIKKIKEEL